MWELHAGLMLKPVSFHHPSSALLGSYGTDFSRQHWTHQHLCFAPLMSGPTTPQVPTHLCGTEPKTGDSAHTHVSPEINTQEHPPMERCSGENHFAQELCYPHVCANLPLVTSKPTRYTEKSAPGLTEGNHTHRYTKCVTLSCANTPK